MQRQVRLCRVYDEPVRVLSVVGLAFLLLLAGLEIDVDRLRGPVLRRTSAAFVLSFPWPSRSV